MNRTGAGLPDTAPTSFVRQRWTPHVLPGGSIDRRYYELCVLSELRDRLRAGDVWVSLATARDLAAQFHHMLRSGGAAALPG